jgi:Xaa-Pro aminopeptidase
MKKFLAAVSLLTFCSSALPLRANTTIKNEPEAIRVTPVAPRFTDAERQIELAARRARVLERMADNSMMILMSAEPKNYAGDVDFMYRQENNLYYLTNLRQRGATLVLIKDGKSSREILFLPKRNPASEAWDGKMYARDDAQRISGVNQMIDASETNAFLQAVKDKKAFAAKEGVSISANAATLYLLLPEDEQDGDGKAEYRRESEYAKSFAGYKTENARSIFDELRLIKSPYEIKLMQHAIDITTEAQMRSMAIVNRAKYEYEVQAEVEYTFRRRNADYWGYPSIVGCGPNATTLHYVESQGEVKTGDLMLMDVGAEYEHYTADVTRTYPVNGKFSKEQADIYQIVYDAQEAAAGETKPGVNFSQVSQAADKVLKEGLAKLGLITAPNATYQMIFQGKTVNLPQFKLWYIHGFGHWLGMNVHDVGDYKTPLRAGMIFTNEPGIYIREDALDYLADTPENKKFLEKVRPVYEKYKNIGVRIEDDLLVTTTGAEWMTKNLPRKIDEVEAFMARASKEMNYSRLNREMNPTLVLFGFDGKSLFDFKTNSNSSPMSGRSVRRGWIWTGKETTVSGLNHVGHAHGE